MPRYRIPKNAGLFHVVIAMAGNYAVANDKTGGNKIVVPCRDEATAKELCRKLNDEDHDGEIWL